MVDPSQVRNEDLQLALCGRAERAEQARLFDACFKKGATPEDLAWRYDLGPHGQAVSILARPPGGEGISGYACSPRRALCYGDESTLAPVGETGDVMTHPDWRKRGIFSSLDRRCMEEVGQLGWPLVFGLPNRRSAHIFLELGWERIGTVRPYSFPLRADAAARAEAFREGRLRAWLLPLHVARSGRLLRRSERPDLTTRRLERFPPETLDLSRALEKRFAFMVRRDPDYLNWRFVENPARLHDVLGVYRGEELVALVTVQRPRAGSCVGFLVDVLAPGEDALSAAVGIGLRHLGAAGASVVQSTAIDRSWWADKLKGSGFLPPKESNHLIVILHPHDRDHPLVKAAREASSWFFTDGDRDDATMG
ncbi:MAG: GNAT family N-acetyltransferase [Planctomycetota bacterium]